MVDIIEESSKICNFWFFRSKSINGLRNIETIICIYTSGDPHATNFPLARMTLLL